MRQEREKTTAERRAFLKLASLGTAAGAAAVVSGGAVEAATPHVPVTAESKGYRETAHVRRYYELARF
jgi:hypothetical protein